MAPGERKAAVSVDTRAGAAHAESALPKFPGCAFVSFLFHSFFPPLSLSLSIFCLASGNSSERESILALSLERGKQKRERELFDVRTRIICDADLSAMRYHRDGKRTLEMCSTRALHSLPASLRFGSPNFYSRFIAPPVSHQASRSAGFACQILTCGCILSPPPLSSSSSSNAPSRQPPSVKDHSSCPVSVLLMMEKHHWRAA